MNIINSADGPTAVFYAGRLGGFPTEILIGAVIILIMLVIIGVVVAIKKKNK